MENNMESEQGMSKTLVVLLVILILLILGGGAWYWYTQMRPTKTTTPTTTTPTTTKTTTPTTKETPIEHVTDPGVTWLSKPEKLEDLKLFQENSMAGPVTYYKIADLAGGGELIYAAEESLGISVYRFKKDSGGKYYLLRNHSAFIDNPSKILNTGVDVDYNTKYISLSPPSSFTVNGLALKDERPIFFSEGQFFDTPVGSDTNTLSKPKNGTVTKFGTTEYGDIYSWVTPVEIKIENGSLKAKIYILVLADTSTSAYQDLKDFLADDGSIIGELNSNGQSFKSRKFSANLGTPGGCGTPSGNHYLSTIDSARLKVIGKTNSSADLYIPANNDDDILKNAYENYKIGRDYPQSTDKAISYEDFVAKKPVFLWKDAVGDYLVFMDKDFAALVECGKPVVYLYPTKTIPVSVQVGARIKISEPAYNNGWKVIAQPSGLLTTFAGQQFQSLYWEGKGMGVYPAITQGRIVLSVDIEEELRKDLSIQGLTANETQDFLNFWLPRMPKTKYTRLAWLGTPEMNQLAPLTINPQPNTVIRVFLDFEGLNSAQTDLKPQALQWVERKGFTVVEWGGLLVGSQ